MGRVLLACKTLEAEVCSVLDGRTESDLTVEWVSSGLHDTPSLLRDDLQHCLDAFDDSVERVFMTFGWCGGSVVGLETRGFTTIMPRVDDCISLLSGSMEARAAFEDAKVTYFLTPGWLDGETNIYQEYLYSLGKYGQDMTHEIYQSILGHYQYLGMLETGAYDVDAFAQRAETVADTLGLALKRLPASTRYLHELLDGPWPANRFVTVPPNSTIEAGWFDFSGQTMPARIA
ncbi:MAG: DUF1638 domain-containing protein [Eggerthellaceae bacterium]|nr:DUF1638 domain-containing protein [Eggerthellaceae bacterium]